MDSTAAQPIGWGVLIAALGACLFAVGASLQHRAVSRNRTGPSIGLRSFMAAVRTRDWLVGGLFSGGGAILHALALGLAPLSLIQPVGVLALGLTAIINARYTGRRLSGTAMAAAALSTLGVTAFLVLAGSAAHATEVHHDSETAAGTMAGLAFALLAGLALLVGGWGRGLALSGAAGTAYGVSSLLLRGLTQDLSDGGIAALQLWSVAGLVTAWALGGWCMQQAYAAGPPHLAVASVTVIDPVVAVAIGVLLLGEASGASPWLVLAQVAAAALAVGSVIVLSSTAAELEGRPPPRTSAVLLSPCVDTCDR